MTEFDLQKMQLKKMRVTITWATLSIVLSIIGSTIWGSFQLGKYWNQQTTFIKETRVIADEAKAEVSSMKSTMYSFGIIQSNHTVEIDNLKAQNKHFKYEPAN